MPVTPISKEHALSRSADGDAELWVFPNRKNSVWSQKIDWHLNFLVSRASQHKTPAVSPFLTETMHDNESPLLSLTLASSSPLLLSTNSLLPASRILRLTWTGELAPWLDSFNSIWTDLGRPRVRLFLPKGVSISNLTEEWKRRSKQDIEAVEELS